MRPATIMVIETRLDASGAITITGCAKIVDESDPANVRTLSTIRMPLQLVPRWFYVIEGINVFTRLGFQTRLKVVTTNVKGSIHG